MMQGHGQLRRQQTEKKKSEPVKQAESGEMQTPEVEVETSAEQVMYLQRTIGNQATKRFLQAKRTSLIQRDGEGGAPAITPEAAMARAEEIETECAALRDAARESGDPSQADDALVIIKARQTELTEISTKLRGLPGSEVITNALQNMDVIATGLVFTLVEVEDIAEAVDVVTFHADPSASGAAPPPTPTPTPVSSGPAPTPAPVPDDPGLSKMDKAKGYLAKDTPKKIKGSAELIAGQDRGKMYEKAQTRYGERPEKPAAPDPDGSRTSALFAPLKEVSGQVKSFKHAAADTVFGWLEPFLSFLDTVPGVNILSGLVMSGKGAYDSYKRRKAFAEANTTASTNIKAKQDASASPTKADLEVQKSADYAYKKSNRAFWEGIGKFVTTVAKYILRLITILTGGTSALVTETGALLIEIGQGALSLGHKVKGGIKRLFGMRGRNRRLNATTVYNHAKAGDPVALKLVMDLKPYGTWASIKAKLPGTDNPPSTPSEMQAYLNAHAKGAEQKALILEIANKMKST